MRTNLSIFTLSIINKVLGLLVIVIRLSPRYPDYSSNTRYIKYPTLLLGSKRHEVGRSNSLPLFI